MKLIFLVLSLASLCRTLYFVIFIYFYFTNATDELFISLMIGSTTLVVVFWGPKAGKIVDKSRHKFLFASGLAAVCGLAILLQVLVLGISSATTYLYPLALVVLFALAFNPLTSIINQYLIPKISPNQDVAYSVYERVDTAIGVVVGIFLFAAFDYLNFASVMAFVGVLYLVLGLIIFLCSKTKYFENPILDENLDSPTTKNNDSSASNFLRQHKPLTLITVCLAIIVSAFGATAELIGLNLTQFPTRFIFLIGLFQNVIAFGATWLYEGFSKDRKNDIFIVICAAIIGGSSLMFAMNLFELTQVQTIFAFSAVIALMSIAGQLWGLLSITHVRNITHDNNFATTFSYFRVPRALSTFIGVTSVGYFINNDIISVLMSTFVLLGAALLILRTWIDFQPKDVS